jgi:hypothetical protein
MNGKVTVLGMFFLASIVMLAIIARQPAAFAQYEMQTIFVDPFSIDGSQIGVGNSVTVNINISNAVNLWSAQAGLKFNPAILECTGVAIGEFWKRQGESLNLWMPGTINNTAGEVAYCGMSFTSPAVPQSGSGTLMTATFKVKASGISDIHLTNVKTNTKTDSTVTVTPCRVLEKFTLLADSSPYIVSILHNATGATAKPATGIPGMSLDQAGKSIAFSLTFKSYVTGKTMTVYCNVTIPKNFMQGPWTITIDGTPVTPTTTEDTENTYIHFTTTYTTTTATKNIIVQGSWIVPELQPLAALLLLATASATALKIANKKLHKNKL